MAADDMPPFGEVVQIPTCEAYSRSGVYFLLLAGQIVYVGQSDNMRKRIGNHLTEGVKNFDSVACIPCDKRDLLRMERHYIEKYVPRYNMCASTKALRKLKGEGWEPTLTPLTTVQDTVVLQPLQAACFLGISEECLLSLGDDGPPFEVRRVSRSRSRVRVYRFTGLQEYLRRETKAA